MAHSIYIITLVVKLKALALVSGAGTRSTEQAVRGDMEGWIGSRSSCACCAEPDSQERRVEHMPVLTIYDLGGTGALQSRGSCHGAMCTNLPRETKKLEGAQGNTHSTCGLPVSISLPQEDPLCTP